MVQTRGIDASRVITVDGGHRAETEGELWLSPAGAGAPPLRPTIDAKYVKLRGSLSVTQLPCDAFY
jgi:hypothetical protein